MRNPPLHRFEEYGRLTASEREAVLKLAEAPYSVDKARSISREGQLTASFFLLLDGWAGASHVLPNGSRQIVKVHLPGDALGTPSMAMKRTTEDLFAITDVVVAKVPLPSFGAIFDSHPRLAARFMLSIQYIGKTDRAGQREREIGASVAPVGGMINAASRNAGP